EKKLFIKYSLDKMAYSEIGELFGVSNERIRQIYNNSVDLICNRLEDNPNLFLQSVCLIADKLGDELNPQKLEYHLKEVGILDSKNNNKDQTTLNMCLALMINKKTSILIDPMYKS
ncbi:MAG: hypothetical protein K0B14_19530, partial [Anaerolineaceae bacterium]|nr:hypothetical protein [Anaerolineaceae bacterium]